MTRAIFLTCLDRVRPLTTDAEHVDGSLFELDEHAIVASALTAAAPSLPWATPAKWNLNKHAIFLSGSVVNLYSN